MTRREKRNLLIGRVIASLIVAFGLFMAFFTTYGISVMAFGGIIFVLMYGLKCNYEDNVAERALLKEEKAKAKEAEQKQKEADLT